MDRQQVKRRKIVVLGAGVAGLTTAVALQETGNCMASIISEALPSDPKKADYTSLWAGAHQALHVGGDERARQLEEDTFKVMWELSDENNSAGRSLRRVKEHEFFENDLDIRTHWMPDFTEIQSSALVHGARRGYSYSTYTVDPPLYLNYLLSRFVARGGAIFRGKVQHIKQIFEGGIDAIVHGRASAELEPIDALVVCAGLGARILGGVEDQTLYPNRGQVVLLEAPWITEAFRMSDSIGGDQTYIIPRKNGVSLGGTKSPHDWFPVARPETTDDILQRCLTLCPELVPPEVRAERSGTIKDLRPLIVGVGCGFRPAREGGVRLESEWVRRSGGYAAGKGLVIYNYGHSGKGFVTSWACATAVIDMLAFAMCED